MVGMKLKKLQIVLFDKNRKTVTTVDLEGDQADQAANAGILIHKGKYYSYSKLTGLGKAEFGEVDPPMTLPD
jgi:hypothetical protein